MQSDFPGSPPPVTEKPATSGLAVAGLLFAFLCAPVGAILAILALVKMGRDPRVGGKGLAIAALVVSGLWMICIPIPAAIAIPNFVRFQARAKQAECRSNLKGAWLAQRSFFQDQDRYSEHPAEVGFSVEPRTRYAYFFGPEVETTGAGATAVAAGRDTELDAAWRAVQSAGLTPGVHGECPDCSFLVACAGKVDGRQLDVWSVSSVDRTAPGGERVPAGDLMNHSGND